MQDSQFTKIKKDVLESTQKLENLDVVPRPDWEKYCSRVAERIMSDQSPERLYEVRGMLYELLVHCIPANVVLSVSVGGRHYMSDEVDTIPRDGERQMTSLTPVRSHSSNPHPIPYRPWRNV